MRGETTRCGLDAVLDVVGGKWKTLILWELHPRPRRFGELRRLVEGITEKVLIQQVRAGGGWHRSSRAVQRSPAQGRVLADSARRIAQ